VDVTRPLQDSTGVLGDADALTARFRADGYLFFPGLLDSARVDTLRRQILHALSPLGWLAPGSDPDDALPAEEVRREGLGDWWDGYRAIQSLEAFHALGHDDAILRAVAPLLGGEILAHPRKIARVTYPSSEYPTPPHQDFPLIQGSADTFTVWVPIGTCTVEMGALRVLSGSHRLGLRRAVDRFGVGGVGVDIELDGDDPRWATVEYRSGDALVFHSLTVHWAPPNCGAQVRLSADYRYQALADPVVEGSLLPHGYPNVPGWDELSRGWTSTRWVDRPAGVALATLGDPRGDLGRPPTRWSASLATQRPA
jgi:hypothetical protein